MIEGHKIGVVVPAYRAANEIEGVLAEIPVEVDRVYVIDDASPDDIPAALRRVHDPRVSLIRHEANQGVGGATVSGFRAALESGDDIVVKCDGDGQMDPRQIPRLVAPLVSGLADYAKGNRFHHFGELRSMPFSRFLGNVALTFFTKAASGYWHVLDPVNGFIGIRAETLRQLPLHRVSKRYFFETDLLIRLNVIEATVFDVPLPARYGDEGSSLSVFRSLFTFPPRLLAGLCRRLFWRYLFYDVSPVAIFGFLGLALALFGVVFGLYEWIKYALAGVTAPVGTIMFAVLPLIIGFQLLLQAIVLDIQSTPGKGSPQARRSIGVPEMTLPSETRR